MGKMRGVADGLAQLSYIVILCFSLFLWTFLLFPRGMGEYCYSSRKTFKVLVDPK